MLYSHCIQYFQEVQFSSRESQTQCVYVRVLCICVSVYHIRTAQKMQSPTNAMGVYACAFVKQNCIVDCCLHLSDRLFLKRSPALVSQVILPLTTSPSIKIAVEYVSFVDDMPSLAMIICFLPTAPMTCYE